LGIRLPAVTEHNAIKDSPRLQESLLRPIWLTLAHRFGSSVI
jgi:hypothetical protein